MKSTKAAPKPFLISPSASYGVIHLRRGDTTEPVCNQVGGDHYTPAANPESGHKMCAYCRFKLWLWLTRPDAQGR